MLEFQLAEGKIQITELNGFELNLSGMNPAILVVHNDRFGAIATVTNILMKHSINIGHMEVSRKERGEVALMAIEMDTNIEDDVIEEVKKHCLAIIQVTKNG